MGRRRERSRAALLLTSKTGWKSGEVSRESLHVLPGGCCCLSALACEVSSSFATGSVLAQAIGSLESSSSGFARLDSGLRRMRLVGLVGRNRSSCSCSLTLDGGRTRNPAGPLCSSVQFFPDPRRPSSLPPPALLSCCVGIIKAAACHSAGQQHSAKAPHDISIQGLPSLSVSSRCVNPIPVKY